jgi:broad specificity phosphatase PhoE
MLNIYLARHGQDEDNVNGILNGRRDKPLTQKGIEQAQDLAKKIKEAKISFDKIYSSPLKRSYKTAEVIADTLNLEKPEILKDLIERDFGIMTGKSNTQIEEICQPNIIKTGTVTYFLSPEGAETFPQLVKRGKKILDTIKQHHKEGNILLVSHGDIGKMIYVAYYGLEWKDTLEMFHFGNSDLLLMSDNSPAEDAHVFKNGQFNL